jgi:hypothetical protein
MSFRETSNQGNDLLARVNMSYNLDTKFNWHTLTQAFGDKRVMISARENIDEILMKY